MASNNHPNYGSRPALKRNYVKDTSEKGVSFSLPGTGDRPGTLSGTTRHMNALKPGIRSSELSKGIGTTHFAVMNSLKSDDGKWDAAKIKAKATPLRGSKGHPLLPNADDEKNLSRDKHKELKGWHEKRATSAKLNMNHEGGEYHDMMSGWHGSVVDKKQGELSSGDLDMNKSLSIGDHPDEEMKTVVSRFIERGTRLAHADPEHLKEVLEGLPEAAELPTILMQADRLHSQGDMYSKTAQGDPLDDDQSGDLDESKGALAELLVAAVLAGDSFPIEDSAKATIVDTIGHHLMQPPPPDPGEFEDQEGQEPVQKSITTWADAFNILYGVKADQKEQKLQKAVESGQAIPLSDDDIAAFQQILLDSIGWLKVHHDKHFTDIDGDIPIAQEHLDAQEEDTEEPEQKSKKSAGQSEKGPVKKSVWDDEALYLLFD